MAAGIAPRGTIAAAPSGEPSGTNHVQLSSEPEVAQKMAALGFEKIASTPDEFARRIRADIPEWAKVIQTANIRVD
jgi:tripartite-type tricarboxylate transporter receptor subunit TctC